MEIKYTNEKIKQNYENHKFMEIKFGKEITKAFEKFKEDVLLFENLHRMQQAFRGYNIEKLVNKNNLYSARLNKKYRIEFSVDDDLIINIKEIKIERVHPHEYK